MILFIECLTVRTLIRGVLPYVVRHCGDGSARWFVFDGSRPGVALARLLGRLLGVSVERLEFDMLKVRDGEGRSAWLRALYDDLLELEADVTRDPEFLAFIDACAAGRPRLPMYLVKALGTSTARLNDRQTLWRALLVVHVCAWRLRQTAADGRGAVCFLERRPWDAAVARHASALDLAIAPIPPTRRMRDLVKPWLPAGVLRMLSDLRSAGRWNRRRHGRASTGVRAPRPRPDGARLAVEYYGHLNLDHPERYSNLFFWQQSSVPAERIVVTFNLPQAPLDDAKWAELARHGMSAVALRPEATTLPWALAGAPLRRPRGGRDRAPDPRLPPTAEGRWLARQLQTYRQERAFWTELLAAQRIKLYVSWFKVTETPCAIADALQSLGGITAIYQRSFETHPSVQLSTAADVVFGCSALTAEVERRSRSQIPYFVVTGYIGDHRAALWRGHAEAIRQRLRCRGVTRILAYCDENSSDERRWGHGHALMREAYAFLLERVLHEPWLALLIKPKTPRTLRARLGPVAALLAQAEATGRCLVFDEGQVQGSVPPVAAAVASDALVHGHLWGATAGVESALAGVPTLLMDREGWPSPFHQLGVGRVVFTDWPSLWKACVEHWNRPGGIPGFGDWAPMAEALDPFRDGHAAERMGAYLQWLLEGFDAGWDRETVMAAAAERYADRWGRDKVLQVNAKSGTATNFPAQPYAVSEISGCPQFTHP